MSRDMLLMMKDKVVMRVNLDTSLFNVVDEKLLPFTMQNKLRQPLPEKDSYTRYEMTQQLVIGKKNYDALLSFLSFRILPITRENAKKIYNLFGFAQLQDEISKSKIALVCRALSLQDNYWVKVDGDNATWSDVCLRNVSLSEAVAQVSLHGSSLTLTNKRDEAMRTPELTGQGAYAKAWVREPGGLYLYKRGANGVTESKIEVMVSDLLDNCNVNHLKYEAGESNGEYICKCKCMTDDTISILSGMDFDTWCTVRGVDSHKEALRIDPESIYKMWIVDYLISNRDRHGLNWGFFYNCDTMQILGCHPLYDHNNSFDTALMQDDDAGYLYDDSMTMKQAAMEAMKHVDFHFYKEPIRSDFMTDRQYQSYTRRAKQLGIKVLNDRAISSVISKMNGGL